MGFRNPTLTAPPRPSCREPGEGLSREGLEEAEGKGIGQGRLGLAFRV